MSEPVREPDAEIPAQKTVPDKSDFLVIMVQHPEFKLMIGSVFHVADGSLIFQFDT